MCFRRTRSFKLSLQYSRKKRVSNWSKVERGGLNYFFIRCKFEAHIGQRLVAGGPRPETALFRQASRCGSHVLPSNYIG